LSGAADKRETLRALLDATGAERASPPLLLPSRPYFDLAGEEFGRRMLLVAGSDSEEWCLRPDFTLPIAIDYLRNRPPGTKAVTYLGPIFRRREDGPVEFDQGGLELLAEPDPDRALERVFGFARDVLGIFAVPHPVIRLGGIALFETVLQELDISPAWRARIRNRFGHVAALDRLLGRLATPQDASLDPLPSRDVLLEETTQRMLAAGLSLTEGRSPEEIVDRYIEQQRLEAESVSLDALSTLGEYLAISGPASSAIEAIEQFAERQNLPLEAPLNQIRQHLDGFPNEMPITFEASFSPPLDYYTGLVFEVTGRKGEVLISGGQYDRLLERLGAKAPIAASGCAIWVDRLERETAS
jgi:ATP phosphoribosyltransferase regulatory subunit